MKKKSITLLLVVMISFSLLLTGGCGGTAVTTTTTTEASVEDTTEAETETTVEAMPNLSGTIRFLLPDEGVKDEENVYKAVYQKLKADGLDFTFDFTYIPYDDYDAKQALVVASAEDYDLTWAHINNITTQIAQGMFAPLNDALDMYGPDLQSSTPDYVFAQVTFQGQIYAIPRVVPMAQNDWAFSVRGDLRKKYGVPEIKTLADFESYMEVLKKNEPSMIPVYIDNIREIFRAYCPGSIAFPSGSGWDLYVDLTDPALTVKNFYATDMYENICNKIYEWVQKGYMAKDRVAINDDPQGAFVAGKLGSCDANVMWPTEKIEAVKANNPDAEIEIGFLNPEKPKYVLQAVDNMLAVFSMSTKVNESVSLLNWQRTNQENYDLFGYGVLDVNYKLSGMSLSYQGIPDEKKYVPVLGWIWNDLRFDRYSEKLDPAYLDVIKNWDADAVISPLLGLAIDETPFKDLLGALDTVRSQYIAQTDKGQVKYSDIKDEMLAKFKSAGLDTEIAEVQKQINEFVAAQ